jgi:hypothetical protein
VKQLDVATLELVKQALAGLEFGQVTIAVHDGEVVQIERTEKVRPKKLRERT